MAAPEFTYRVLGSLEVEASGVPVHLGSPRQRAILGILLINANRVVSTDELIEALWSEEHSDTALATLQVHVSKLRSALVAAGGGQPIATVGPGYMIKVEGEALDLLRFESGIARARDAAAEGDHIRAARFYREALSVWRGRPLADLDLPVISQAAHRMEQARQHAIGSWLESELACGRHSEILQQLSELADEHPYDERIRGFLMVSLYRAGRQADALAAYRSMWRILDEELGLEPGPELQKLEERILQHDPSLRLSPIDMGSMTHQLSKGALSIGVLTVGGRDVDLAAAVTTIGRAPDRAIVLADASVSRHHAEIRRTAGGYAIADLGSTNGTRVNGELVSRVELHDFDVILAGDVAMTFHTVAPPSLTDDGPVTRELA